jgi:very-short-patch-repair endonuclease
MTLIEKLQKTVEPYKGSLKFVKEGLLQKQWGEGILKEINGATLFLTNVKLQERCYCILRDIKVRPVCQTCGQPVQFRTLEINGSRYAKTCSNKCKGANKEVQDKKRRTNLEKYGSTNVLNSDLIKSRREDILLEKYGVTNYFQSEEYKTRLQSGEWQESREKAKITVAESMLDFGYNKILEKSKLQNCQPSFERKDYKGHYLIYKWLCLKCNNTFNQYLAPKYDLYCPTCNKGRGTKIEIFIEDILKEYKFDYLARSKSILDESRQLDFYIPSKNLAIEVNGLYWHSESIIKDKDYHLDKLRECEQKGIRLLQIFHDEINHSPDIVKSRILSILGISNQTVYARDCIVEEVKYADIREFYENNHIQGGVNSSINFTLKYDNNIVAALSFTNFRPSTGNENINSNAYELTRYATLLNYNIPGGFSRLLSHFKEKYKPEQIISYCDRRWSQGNMYKKNGFNLIKETTPNYWYMTKDCMTRLHRYNFQKHLLKEKLEIFDENLTEVENMLNNGYNRIWDCGSYLFEWKSL